jgi:hypothetical protein
MSRGNLPDFKSHCQAACVKLWGQPSCITKRELRWNGSNSYGYRTFNLRKRVWYDAGAKRGGSTLELVAYAKGEPVHELRGAAFFETWQEAHKMGLVPSHRHRKRTAAISRAARCNTDKCALRYHGCE